jgi:hypothetical protein
MLSLVAFANRTQAWFPESTTGDTPAHHAVAETGDVNVG